MSSECQTVWIQIRPGAFVGPDLCLNCLQRLLTDGRQVKSAYCVIVRAFLSSADSFQNPLIRNILSEIPSECQPVWTQFQARRFVLSDLGAKFCKGYQQTTKDVTNSTNSQQLIQFTGCNTLF